MIIITEMNNFSQFRLPLTIKSSQRDMYVLVYKVYLKCGQDTKKMYR